MLKQQGKFSIIVAKFIFQSSQNEATEKKKEKKGNTFAQILSDRPFSLLRCVVVCLATGDVMCYVTSNAL